VSSESEEKNNALVKQEPQLVPEMVPQKDGSTSLRMRDKKTGAFVQTKVKASVRKTMRHTIDFMHSKPSGKDKSRLDAWYEALDAAILSVKDNPDNLLAATKAIEALDKIAHGSKTRDRMVEETSETNTVKVIIVQPPKLPNNEPKQEIVTPKKPSWLDENGEEKHPKQPAFIDAEIVNEGK